MPQDIDKLVLEEIKKGMTTLGDSIDTKLEKAAKAAEEAGDVKLAKLNTDVKAEVEAQIAKYNELHEKYTKRLDIIETKAGKFGQVGTRKNMADMFAEKMVDMKDKKGFKGIVEFKPEDYDGVEKADDMTAANTFTNNVPG